MGKRSRVDAKAPTGGFMREGFKVFQGRIFIAERILVDGCQFEGCTFTDCTLVFAGTGLFMVQLDEHQTINVDFVGNAAVTLNQLRALHRFGMAEMVERVIASIRNPLNEPVN